MVLLFTLGACDSAPETPEAEVRALLAAGEEHIEQADVSALSDMIASHYSDSRGNDKRMLVRQLRLWGLSKGRRELLVDIAELNVHADSAATVILGVRFIGTGNGFRLDAGAYQVTLNIERSDEKVWTVVSSRWARAGEAPR